MRTARQRTSPTMRTNRAHTPLHNTATESVHIPSANAGPSQPQRNMTRASAHSLPRIRSGARTGTLDGDETVATSFDRRDDATPLQDQGTRVIPELEGTPSPARRGQRSNPVELTDSPNHGSQPTTTPPPGSSRTLTRSRAGATGIGPESEPTEGGQEPLQRTRTPPSTTPETTEVNAELPVCSICLGDASNPSVSLPECSHAMCMKCYARACVREISDILHCSMCRVGSAISETSDRLRR